jgi:cytidylate kinase
MAGDIIVAIDGYSSCGKSTLARELAAHLEYNYIDSGAMYRAITLYFLRNHINEQDPAQIMSALAHIRLAFVFNRATNKGEIHLNDENVEHLIREMMVAEKVSDVAALKEVRSFAVGQQKKMGRKKGIVMDGRDIGTVVFPDAELKIFMTADPAIRVLRRFEELFPTNHNLTLDEVRHNLEMRDYMDTNRTESPLIQAPDAILIDNTNITRVEQLEMALGLVKERASVLQ